MSPIQRFYQYGLFRSADRVAAAAACTDSSHPINSRAFDHPVTQIARAAQPGIAADRFAREIGRFLRSFCAARSRQLNANPLDGERERLLHRQSCILMA